MEYWGERKKRGSYSGEPGQVTRRDEPKLRKRVGLSIVG